MKKVTLILAVVALMISTNLFTQENASLKVEKIAIEILKAYKTKDVEFLKKHASVVLKPALSKDYFEDENVKKDIDVIKKWDGKIREVRYEVQSMGPMKIYMASVYFTEAQASNEICELLLSDMNNQGWVMVGEGIIKEKKTEFDKLSKTLKTDKPAAAKKNISIEMANGDKFKNASVETAINNFFIILNNKKDFMQIAYGEKGYTVEYKENEIQYEAKELVSKEKPFY